MSFPSTGVLSPALLKRRHLIFAVVTVALLMASIDSTIVNIALPTIRLDLHTNIIWAGWTVAGYQLGQLLILPLAGKMSDEWGRRRVFIVSLAVFTTASCLCGLAPNVYFLVAARVVQALGGGCFMPSCTGIVADLYPENRSRMIGLFSSVFPLGGILGPNLGGFLIDTLSWRYVFFVNVPLGLFAIVATLALYREQRAAQRSGIDYLGSFSYGLAILLFIMAATWVGEDTAMFRSALPWAALLGAVGLGFFFFRHEDRVENPIVAPALLKERSLIAVNLYNFVFGMGNFGVLAFFPTYLEERYGFSAIIAGALLTPRAVAMICFSIIASVFIIRLGYRIPTIIKCILQAVMLTLLGLGLTTVHLGPIVVGTIVWLSFIMVLTGTALGIGQPAANNAALDVLPGKIASATGVRNMFRLTGGLLGTSLVAIILGAYGPGREVIGFAVVFNILAVINLCNIPIVFLIPDSARMRRLAAQREAAGEGPAAEEVLVEAG